MSQCTFYSSYKVYSFAEGVVPVNNGGIYEKGALGSGGLSYGYLHIILIKLIKYKLEITQLTLTVSSRL